VEYPEATHNSLWTLTVNALPASMTDKAPRWMLLGAPLECLRRLAARGPVERRNARWHD
jgi:hypothetical protein